MRATRIFWTFALGLVLAACAAFPSSSTAAPAGDPAAASIPVTAGSPPTPAAYTMPELAIYFEGFDGSFVLYDPAQNRLLRYNPRGGAARYLPASTFKILNSLIGLETGVIADEDDVIAWDGTPQPVETWNQDHSLESAIRESVIWYYQELARRVGEERMRQWVEAVGYGNADISGAIDTFWLEGALRISADEQVDFLRRFYFGELPFSARSVEIVKKILVLEETEEYRLSGKTGSVVRGVEYVGWFVGYLEKDGQVYFFASNIHNSQAAANGVKAQAITRAILQGLGLLPED